MKIFTKIALTIIMVLYPVGVYFGLRHFEPKNIGLALIVLLLIRAAVSRSLVNKENLQLSLIGATAGLLLGGFSFIANNNYGIKLYPVAVSLTFLAIFVFSLYKPPSMIEKFARLQDPELSEEGVAYTRLITKIWCGFFVVNASISVYTALATSLEVWTLYNGFISYLLMGFLFLAELAYRKFFLKIG